MDTPIDARVELTDDAPEDMEDMVVDTAADAPVDPVDSPAPRHGPIGHANQSRGSEARVTVLLPSALAERTGNRTTVAVAGGTVREVIEALDAAYPGLRFNLCHETGELRPFVNVFVNGAHVRYLRGLETPLPAGATLHILPSVAGG